MKNKILVLLFGTMLILFNVYSFAQDSDSSYRFDFGPEKGQVGVGYTPVSPDSIYTTHSGFGWIGSEPVSATVRSKGDAVDQDFAQARRAVFRLDVPDGWYDVAVRTGDDQPRGKQLIMVEGREVFSGSIDAGEYTTMSRRVRVADQYLEIELFALRDPQHPSNVAGAIINALIVSKLDLGQQINSWQAAADGYYRVASELEAARNHWPFGTQLVWRPTALGRIRSSVVTLLVPTLEEQTGVVQLKVRVTGNLPPAFELSVSDSASQVLQGQPALRDSTGAFRVYGDDPDHPTSWLVVDELRHGAAGFVDAGFGSYVEIESGESSWTLDASRLPNGDVPVAEHLYAVKPGAGQFPSPPAEKTSGTDSSALTFAFIGEIKWCTSHPATWAATLAARGIFVGIGYQSSTTVHMNHSLSLCNMAGSVQAASDCAIGNTCPNNVFGHSYSFFGCVDRADCYMSHVKENLQQAHDEGFSVPKINLAQVVHDDFLKGQVDLADGGHANITLCGLSALPGVVDATGMGDCVGSIDHPEGASVVAFTDDCSAGRTSIHEFGHNLGAIHSQSEDLGFPVCEDSVMGEGNGTTCGLFGDANAATVASCLNEDFASLSYVSASECSPLIFVTPKNCPIHGGAPFFQGE